MKKELPIKSITFTDISWDKDGQKVKLPNEVTLNIEDVDIDLGDSPKDAIALEGADVLSDKYGWCVNSFNFTINT